MTSRNFLAFSAALAIVFPLITFADDLCEYEGGDGGVDYQISECTKQIQSGITGQYLAGAYVNRAEAYIRKGNFASASDDSSKALALLPKNSTALLLHGEAQQGGGDFKNAISDYSNVIEQSPDNHEAFTKRGSAFGLMGKLDLCIADSTKAVALASNGHISITGMSDEDAKDVIPGRARALYNRGLAWKLKGDFTRAIEDYKLAVQSNPGDPHSWSKHSTEWSSKSIAEQAEELYKNIEFSSDMNTSDKRIFSIQSIQKTRFGNAMLIQTDILPASTIMLNGVFAYHEPGMYVSVEEYFQRKDSDVLLVESNPGGSATPASQMSILLINPTGTAQALTHPEFNAASHYDIQAKMNKDERIFIKLGFPIEVGPLRGNKEPIAELDNDKLILKLIPRVHGDYESGSSRSFSEYFSNDKWITLTRPFYNNDHSQRVEYYCDDKELVEMRGENETSFPHSLCVAALFVKHSDQWIFSEQFEMPYGGVVKAFARNKLVVESAEYLDSDGFAYPSTQVTRVFKTGTGKLVEVVTERKSKSVNLE